MKATFLLALLLCVLTPGIAHGQCEIQTFPNYAVSQSTALSADGNDIISTVVLDGSSSMQMNYPCPDSIINSFNQGKINIMHYPSVTNTLGAVNSGTNFDAICAECYGSFRSDVDSGPVSPGQILATTYGGQIYCATAGIIFSFSISKYVEIAATVTKNQCVPTTTPPYYSCPGSGGPGDWPVTLWCDASFSPPDYPPSRSKNPQNWPFFEQTAVCVRIGVAGWFCYSPSQNGTLGPDVGLNSDNPVILDANNPHSPCTHNP